MTLKELMKTLSFGELSNLSWIDKNEECGVLKDKQEAVISFIYEGLNKLYSLFYLREDSIYLELIEGKVDYDHYLWKTGDKPFNNDILRIIRIISSTGEILPLNNPEKFNSVFTPSYNKIHVNNLNPEWELEIIYAAKHPELSLEENTVIELPLQLIPAIRAYVAYLVHMNMNTEMAVKNAQKYLNQYNLIVSENIQSDSAFSSNDSRDCKFVLGGWV